MSSGAPRGRILVVDDEADVRQLISRVLKDSGYQVETAADGAEALARLSVGRPDLVLLDIMMPGVDGWTVLAELKKQASPPPVVLVSASADSSTFRRGVREGAAGYVRKPFRFRELVAICERALGENRQQGSAPPLERRRDPRRALVVQVQLLARDTGRQQLGELVDVAPGGAQVHLDYPLDPGTPVRLDFQVPGAGGAEAYSFSADVRWRRDTPQGAAHGLAFAGLGPDSVRRLTELVKPQP